MAIVLYKKSEKEAEEIASQLKSAKNETITPIRVDEFSKTDPNETVMVLDPVDVLKEINKKGTKFDPSVRIIDIWSEDELDEYANRLKDENQKNLNIEFNGKPLIIRRHSVIYSKDTPKKDLVEKGIKPFYEGTSFAYLMYMTSASFGNKNIINNKTLNDAIYLLKERFPRLENLIKIKSSLMLFEALNKTFSDAQGIVVDKLVDVSSKLERVNLDLSSLDPKKFKSKMTEIGNYTATMEECVLILKEARFTEFLSKFLTPASTTASLKEDLIKMSEMTAARLDAASGFWINKVGKKFLKMILNNMSNDLSKKMRREFVHDYKSNFKKYKVEIKNNPSIKNQILLEGFLELAIFFENFGGVLKKQNDVITSVEISENIHNIINSLIENSKNLDKLFSDIEEKEILKNNSTYKAVFTPIAAKWNGIKRGQIDPILSIWKESEGNDNTSLDEKSKKDKDILENVGKVLSFLIKENERIEDHILSNGTMADILKEFIGSVGIYADMKKNIDIKEIKKLSEDLTDNIIQMLRNTINEITTQSDSQEVSREFAEAWEYIKNSVKSGGKGVKKERRRHKILFSLLIIVIILAALGVLAWKGSSIPFLSGFSNQIRNWMAPILKYFK